MSTGTTVEFPWERGFWSGMTGVVCHFLFAVFCSVDVAWRDCFPCEVVHGGSCGMGSADVVCVEWCCV